MPTSRDRDVFHRWRPSYHFIAPKNWMNDPCGPCYDARTKTFHLAYQYNPYGATWGNMTWMHAVSDDLVRWRHASPGPTLAPSLRHDRLGVYSGCILTQGPHGEEGMLTAVYTAISKLPIHYTLPYNWGAEKLAMAVSSDSGRTWQRDESSLILSSPPEEFKGQVIGWRDPFVSSWPALDEHLGHKDGEYLYGLISGGLKDKTPTAFLYQIPRDNLQEWSFLSTIADVGHFFQLDPKNGNMGISWEVCNFFSLAEKGQDFFLMNVEGVGSDDGGKFAMWAHIALEDERPPRLIPKKTALCDHGCLYATTTFLHEPTNRRIMWGWITEHDLAENRYEQQGWAGCMSLPRELFLLTYKNVDASIRNDSSSVAAFQMTPEDDVNNGSNSLNLQTLGYRPVVETEKLRQGAEHILVAKPYAQQRLAIRSIRNFETKIVFAAEQTYSSDAEIGLLISHSPTRYTKIVFKEEAIHVDRSQSTNDPDVNTSTITAPLKLLPFSDGTLEDVSLHLFVDNSVLELFINDRIAITTRIYCDDEDQASPQSVSLHACNIAQPKFLHFEAWVGLDAAMLDELPRE